MQLHSCPTLPMIYAQTAKLKEVEEIEQIE
jgi:hypothetical protein